MSITLKKMDKSRRVSTSIWFGNEMAMNHHHHYIWNEFPLKKGSTPPSNWHFIVEKEINLNTMVGTKRAKSITSKSSTTIFFCKIVTNVQGSVKRLLFQRKKINLAWTYSYRERISAKKNRCYSTTEADLCFCRKKKIWRKNKKGKCKMH